LFELLLSAPVLSGLFPFRCPRNSLPTVSAIPVHCWIQVAISFVQ
jgi:hypothetical protein